MEKDFKPKLMSFEGFKKKLFNGWAIKINNDATMCLSRGKNCVNCLLHESCPQPGGSLIPRNLSISEEEITRYDIKIEN